MPTDKLFTGQRLDSTGLYYYNARYYDPGIGKFISPDSIIPNYFNPQFLNRYSYCLNNPLKYTDSTGHFLDWIFDAASIVFDIGQLIANPSWENGGYLAADVVLGVVPFVPAGVGPAAKVTKGGINTLRALENTNDAMKWISKTQTYASDIARSASKGIRPGTLGAKNARIWYINQLKQIPDYIDTTLPLEKQARQAFELRNAFKAQARNLMNNWQMVEILDQMEPAATWLQMIQKGIEKGKTGDDIYKYIIDASQRSNAEVNKLFGLK